MAFSRKDTPAPQDQRARIPPAIDTETTKLVTSHRDSPPLTPPFRIRTKGYRASKLLKHQQQTPRETYLEDAATPEAHARDTADEPHPDRRISHDLSLTENTRHSVMDNMLLSLNPDQPVVFPTPPSRSRYPIISQPTSPLRSARSRGHKQSASLSSDYTYPSNPSDASPQRKLTRSRRSQSSSNFPTSAGIGKITEHVQSTSSDRPIPILPLTSKSVPSSRSGVRRSGKSSGSSSVDFGHAMISTKWQPHTGRRSSSFDQSHVQDGRAIKYIPASIPSFRPTKISNSYSDQDAAPTPTVPSGPGGRDLSPCRRTLPSQSKHIPPEDSSMTTMNRFIPRKGTKSSGNDGRGANRGSVRGGTGISSSRSSQHMPALRGLINSRAGSPTRAAPNQSTAMRQESSASGKAQKERPGFFRRVFGSKEKTADLRPFNIPSTRDRSRSDSRSAHWSNGRSQRQVAADGADAHEAQTTPPPLTKKPSSFFRRRKKSISEQIATPAMPPHLQTPVRLKTMTAMADGSTRASPVSSLHEAMDSFLSIPDKPRDPVDPRIRQKSYNVDNTVPTDTVIGRSYTNTIPLSKTSVTHDRDTKPLPQIHAGDGASLGKNVPSQTDALNVPDRSFLHDNSSNEDKAHETQAYPHGPHPSEDKSDETKSAAMENRPPKGSGLWPVRSDSFVRSKTVPLGECNINVSEGRSSSRSGKDATPRKSKSGGSRTINDDATPEALYSANSPSQKRRKSSKDGSTAISVPMNSKEEAPVSPASDYHSANSEVSPVWAEDHQAVIAKPEPVPTIKDTEEEVVAIATAQESETAKKIFNGDESVVEKSKVAAWLGETSKERVRLRNAYMDCFDFQDLDILVAFRELCARLILKGETQQVDRILDAFSCRWCQCNPEHGFKATGKTTGPRISILANNVTDVVHTICYSILLLNTDLYMADIDSKMTRAQFIRNTMPTVRRVALDAAPDGFDGKRASTLPSSQLSTDAVGSPFKSSTFPRDSVETKRSFEAQRPSYRLSQRPSDHSGQAYSSNLLGGTEGESVTDTCSALVKAPFAGKLSTWESQVEAVLKDFYNSVRQERLPLHGNKPDRPPAQQMSSSASLSAFTGNMLRRTPSMLSKAGSENLIYRGRPAEQRFGTGRWTSKSRHRPRLYPSSTVGSSRTSFEEQSSSVWSAAVSSTWSKHSFNRTQTSMSTESFVTGFPDVEYQQSIGFANALSQAIIREEAAAGDGAEESMRAAPLLEDESLELAGAPWAKEGILKHKHHLGFLGKKSKDRNWVESFAVIEKGSMRLFSFSTNAKSMRQKAKHQKSMPGIAVGGGNWMDNAEAVGNFSLRQTIASALPPPGYSRTRPHVWALSLPTGAVHLFQVGTPEIVKEFVTTANYWSARLSKEPLVGGVSNIEYGWSDVVINNALAGPSSSEVATSQPIFAPGHHHRPSLQSSIRSSLDQGSQSSRPKLPGDKITIHDWTPPTQSLMASCLLEVDQLRALTSYVSAVEEELERHNELRPSMQLAFSPRHPNSNKAMQNWECKSSFLLKEIVRYRTYIDCLEGASKRKAEIYREREERAGSRGNKTATAAAAEESVEQQRMESASGT